MRTLTFKQFESASVEAQKSIGLGAIHARWALDVRQSRQTDVANTEYRNSQPFPGEFAAMGASKGAGLPDPPRVARTSAVAWQPMGTKTSTLSASDVGARRAWTAQNGTWNSGGPTGCRARASAESSSKPDHPRDALPRSLRHPAAQHRAPQLSTFEGSSWPWRPLRNLASWMADHHGKLWSDGS
jgi:hypothetical protein